MGGSEQQDIILFLVAGMLTLSLLAGGVVLFFVIYQRKTLRQQLLLKEIESIHQEKLLQSNIEELENERKRVAKDLHDEIGGLFSSLKLKIKQIGMVSLEVDESIKKQASEIIDTGITSVRRISHDLLPPGLEIFGLSDTLEEFCNKLHAPGIFEMHYQCDLNDPPRLPVDKELDLYRIIQELTNNTIKHSQANSIFLSMQHPENSVVLSFRDDGKGFDPALLEKGKGLGMRSIEARARRFKGKIIWETAPGMGMNVVIIVPLVKV